jgi:hypothetical protein
MASAPVIPAKPATTEIPAAKPVAAPGIITRVENDYAWLKLHFIAILFFLALLVGGVIGTVSLVEHLEEVHDAHVAAAQLKAENVDTATQQALLTELMNEHAADQARDEQQMATIQSLVTQMQQQHAQTAKQVATDSTLDAQDAAARLVAQSKSSPSEVTIVNGFVSMDLPMTRNVVAQLDLGAQAESDVTNLQGQLTAQQIITTDAKTELVTARGVITADQTTLVATIKADDSACAVKINTAVDAQSKKDRKRGIWAVVLTAIGMAYLLK